MSKRDKVLVYSPEVLTEDGVFAVGAGGVNAVTKNGGKLLIIDPISLCVTDQLGTYPEAKDLRTSPDLKYICFLDTVPSYHLRIIEFDKKTCLSLELNPHFSIHHIFWSPDSRFIVFVAELGVYLGVYDLYGRKFIVEDPSCDDHNLPLVCFNTSDECFTVVKNGSVVSYTTDFWTPSIFKCITNPIGLLYTDSYSLALWNSTGSFVVYSFFGEQLFSRAVSINSRVKAAIMCKERRVIILATFDDKIEIYDVFSWEKLYCFDYPCVLQNVKSNMIWHEPTPSLQFEDNHNYLHQTFQSHSSLKLKPISNICAEFKLKTESKYYLKLSSNNEYIASYTPGFEKTVWIRSLNTGQICGVIMIDTGSVQGFKWHPQREILAVITLDSVIFWMNSRTFAVYCRTLIKSFHWIKSKLSICSVATQTGGTFIYIENE